MNVQVIPKWMLWLVLILHPIIYSQKIKIKTFPQSVKSLIFFSDVVCSLCVCMCLHACAHACKCVSLWDLLHSATLPSSAAHAVHMHPASRGRDLGWLLCTSWRWILMKSNLTKCHTYFSMGENLFVGDEGNIILAASELLLWLVSLHCSSKFEGQDWGVFLCPGLGMHRRWLCHQWAQPGPNGGDGSRRRASPQSPLLLTRLL